MAAVDTTNADNARVYGSDYDSVYLAPIGTALPTSIDDPLDPAFEAVGWLNEDGIKQSPSGSKTKLRGHQGGRVVRTRMTETGTEFAFVALETKRQTESLWEDQKSATVANGVETVVSKAGQKVSARVAVVDLYDADDDTIHERRVYERWEITPDGDREFKLGDITGYGFLAEQIGDATKYRTVGGVGKTGWAVEVTGTPTGGTYTLTVNGSTTAGIAYNATASAVAAALNALPGVTGISGITASGTGTITVTFPSTVTLAGDGSGLTGGTDPDVVVS